MNIRACAAAVACAALTILGVAPAASANLEPPGPCPPESPNMPEWCQPPPPNGPGEPKPSHDRPTRITLPVPDDPDVE